MPPIKEEIAKAIQFYLREPPNNKASSSSRRKSWLEVRFCLRFFGKSESRRRWRLGWHRQSFRDSVSELKDQVFRSDESVFSLCSLTKLFLSDGQCFLKVDETVFSFVSCWIFNGTGIFDTQRFQCPSTIGTPTSQRGQPEPIASTPYGLQLHCCHLQRTVSDIHRHTHVPTCSRGSE